MTGLRPFFGIAAAVVLLMVGMLFVRSRRTGKPTEGAALLLVMATIAVFGFISLDELLQLGHQFGMRYVKSALLLRGDVSGEHRRSALNLYLATTGLFIVFSIWLVRRKKKEE